MSEPFPQLVNAEQQFKGDKYSETRRWDDGYSDCSSFVGKSLKSIGVTPPGNSTTTDYILSTDWILISRADVGAGDICVNAAHMITATDNQNGIGQENPRRNVQTGTIEDLMAGTGAFVCKRYKHASSVSDVADTSVTPALHDPFQIPEGIVNFFNELSNAVYWYRILMVVSGGLLILFSFQAMVKQWT